ncbi:MULTISPECIES: dihydrofolate reductase [unclassified Viridibacillus]|uniref:dihydrofolate reductase n=1 Tax=unclassified Viridibacillus TaxID=2617942 RepID=UPI00096D2C09|nr:MULTISPECIES: dihydrofolate reductase [unclassified Viridibacillus]OMC83876.1 dihydrofolate reductase [Viridibacillus sp. FSL H8-0123]OMC88397.1 dihydrofolate reductase [Viridibacillus sp. FSL H7-0596]
MISLIVAHDENNVIGLNNAMPWHLPGDLAYFKRTTMGKPMIMGRKTFESIGKPLPGRTNIVITRDEKYVREGIVIVHSLEEALAQAKKESEEIMIIGGEQIFRITLPMADRLYVTKIEKQYEGDTFFPSYDEEWQVVSQSEVNETDDGLKFTYLVYERK